jgi:hypothetical protein
MTVPLAPTVYRYEGNGVTAIFSYPNRVFTAADLEVTILTRATDAEVETLTLTTDYTVTIVSNSQANVTVTNVAKIPSGTQDILINLNLAASQTRSFPRADSLPAEAIELGLDKLTLLAQKTNDTLSRSIRFPDSDTTTDGVLPPKAERSLTYLAFDANGVPIASASAAGGAPAGAFGATLVATATQGAAQTLLDAATKAVYDPANISQQVVGTTATQTLTNKTLTSPVLNGTITGNAAPKINNFRLTLTTDVPVTTADVTGASTLYLTPYNGNQIALYNGTAWELLTTAQVSLALSGLTASRPYDVFAYNNAGTVTLEILAWTSDTARATALAYQDGVLVLSGSTTRRYLGTFYSTGTTTTEDSEANRYLWNYYNRAVRRAFRQDATNSWTYSTAAWRQANNSTANQNNFVIGVLEDAVICALTSRVQNSTSTSRQIGAGIGFNTTVGPSGTANYVQWTPGASAAFTLGGSATFLPALGRNYASWLEYGAGSDTQTWFSFNNACGISTQIMG